MGCDVIVDDTSLRARHVRGLMNIAHQAGATVEIIDFTALPLEECVRRDTQRPEPERVGADVIRSLYARYLAQLHGKPLPIPPLPGRTDHAMAVEPYTPQHGTPAAILVDLDGTVALLREGQKPAARTPQSG
jgi:hypothetical protein